MRLKSGSELNRHYGITNMNPRVWRNITNLIPPEINNKIVERSGFKEKVYLNDGLFSKTW